MKKDKVMKENIQELEEIMMKIFKAYNRSLNENQLTYELCKVLKDIPIEGNEDIEFSENDMDEAYDKLQEVDEHLLNNSESKVMMYDPYHGIIYESIDSILEKDIISQMDEDREEDIEYFFEPLLEKIMTIYPDRKDVIDKVQSIVNGYYEPYKPEEE